MITIDEAKKLLKENISLLPVIEIPLSEALDMALAVAVYSPINMPPFRQSSMDGYALCLGKDLHYTIKGELQAGNGANPPMKKGDAFRIFTGSALPDDANAVLMQEKTHKNNNKLYVESNPKIGNSIRLKGEQIKKGAVALTAGTKLNPAAIGFLTTLGITKVKVRRKPKVAILATGNELIKAGLELERGQIYESNSLMLQMALKQTGIATAEILEVKDDYNSTVASLKKVINQYDFIIITGGISVGDYDFVGKALEELKTKKIFYKVRQKPGKPLLVAKYKKCHIFALPGNPASALTSYYQYVLSAIHLAMGQQEYELQKVYLPLEKDYTKKGDRGHFLKAKLTPKGVGYLTAQSSAMLSSFALTNCFIFIPHDQMYTPKGALVEVHLIK